ncbi:MAG: ribonuclease P protein component [Phormidesmis sp.]
MALPKQNRLRSSQDFSQVHRKGSRAATQNMAIRALATQDRSVDGNSSALSSCFGISISRKVSKRAVVRNRIKRQIKAAIRRYLPNTEPGWQVAIVVRAAAVECEFDDFLRELEYLLKKLKILS